MRTCVYVVALTALLVASPAAMAGFSAGSPYVNFAGSGEVDHNATGGVAGWTSNSTNEANSPNRSVGGGVLTYTETWSEPQTLGSMLLITPLRPGRPLGSSGEIWVNTSPDLDVDSWMVKPFNLATDSWALYDIDQTNVYGVQIKITGGDPEGAKYTIGSIGFFAERLEDVAYGMKTVTCADAWERGTTNVTNWDLANVGTRFLSNAGSESVTPQSVAVVFGDEGNGVLLQGLLIETCAYAYSSQWTWDTFDVQVFRDGDWETLGTVVTGTDDLIWIDFGPGGEYAEQVRLASDRRGGGQGQINGIMAFTTIPVPEPATLTLLAAGGLAMLRRRT